MLINFTITIGIIFIAYLLGSFPTGYLAGRVLQGIDIREHGSGSTGATNVLRTLGKVPGSIVLLTDALKGVLAILMARWIFTLDFFHSLPTEWASCLVPLAAIGAIFGHSKSVWLGFKGGKSVATGIGVLLAMCWQVGLAAIAVFAVTIAISRIVSISSIFAAISATIWMVAFAQPLAYIVFAIVGGVYVVWLHRTNIERIMAGTEAKVGQKLASTSSIINNS